MAKRTQQTNVQGLFDGNDYRMLLEARRRLNGLIDMLDKAQACGINCDTLRAMRASIDQQLEQIQHHFMTPPPG